MDTNVIYFDIHWLLTCIVFFLEHKLYIRLRIGNLYNHRHLTIIS